MRASGQGWALTRRSRPRRFVKVDALHTVSSTRGCSLKANRRPFGLASGLRSSCTGATHADATMGIKSIVVARPADGTAANAVHGLFTRGPLRPVLPAEQGCPKAMRDARREGTSAALKARHTPAPQWAQAMKARSGLVLDDVHTQAGVRRFHAPATGGPARCATTRA